MLATFMEVLDTSVANVALPHIAGNLSASIDEVHLGADVLPGCERHHPAAGRLVFHAVRAQAVLHGLCGPVHGELAALRPRAHAGRADLFRVLQGMGGGALQPISQAILVETFPRKSTAWRWRSMAWAWWWRR